MKTSFDHRPLAVAGLLLSGAVLVADGTRFSDFTPLTSSAGPTADEAHPITFGNPAFRQESIADRSSQLAAGMPNSGSWDMNTVNETGAHKGRYLFTVFETGNSGVQRHDLETGETYTIWQSPAPGRAVSFDPSYWTPWGTSTTDVGGVPVNLYSNVSPLRSARRRRRAMTLILSAIAAPEVQVQIVPGNRTAVRAP